MGPIGRWRRPGVVVLLIAATWGVYGLVWLYRVQRELRAHGQHTDVLSPTTTVALLLVPPVNLVFALYLAHALPSWVGALEDQHGRARLNAPLVFVLFVLVMTWPIAVWMIQTALNDHWQYHGARPQLVPAGLLRLAPLTEA
jgi:hypothetical protein